MKNRKHAAQKEINILYSRESFHDIEPRLAVLKLFSNLCGKLCVNGRMNEEVSRPMVRCDAVAACAHTSLIQESRLEIAFLINEPTESPPRYCIRTSFNQLSKSDIFADPPLASLHL